ncbi:hypothetical protein RhiirB3_385397 [Rhizophagus irregularis]|nr:hypothetical protein RhiirB3_385397 [Rhizophagus irregularis]
MREQEKEKRKTEGKAMGKRRDKTGRVDRLAKTILKNFLYYFKIYSRYVGWECGSVGVWVGRVGSVGSVGVWVVSVVSVGAWWVWVFFRPFLPPLGMWVESVGWECGSGLLFIRPFFRPFSLHPPLGLLFIRSFFRPFSLRPPLSSLSPLPRSSLY